MSNTLAVLASAPERTCTIEQVFDANFIELIQLAPKNPSVRALILKLTRKMPPSECETFEQIKEWVERTCETRPLSARAGEVAVSVRIEFSDIQYGKADYSVRRYGADNFEIKAAELTEITERIVARGEGIDGIVQAIAMRIDDDAWSHCDPEMDCSDDYDYSEHESCDHGDSALDYSTRQIKDSVLAFLRARYPELAAEL